MNTSKRIEEILQKFWCINHRCSHYQDNEVQAKSLIMEELRLAKQSMLTEIDRKYLVACEMQADDRSMSYIAKRLGYKNSSGVEWLINHYSRRALLQDQLHNKKGKL